MSIAIPVMSAKEIARFWDYVNSTTPSECWPWTGSNLDRDGYGHFWAHYHNYLAHRIAYFLAFGVFDWNLCVCHHCDNPICCNPAHLFLGTHNDNRADCVRKGRQAKGEGNGSRLHPERLPRGDAHWTRRQPERVQGEANGRAIISEQVAISLRASYVPKYGMIRQLARQFGIAEHIVADVVHGRTWSHLGPSL